MVVGITSIQRNRRPWIVEWIAFHLMIGFNKIIVYSHNSTDGMDDILTRLSSRYPITAYRIDDVQTPQLAAYRHSWDNYGKSVDWMAFIDGDEFLFPTKANTIAEGLAPFEARPLSALAVYWKGYGSSGHVNDPGGLLVENFPRHSRDDDEENRHVKSIVRGGERIDGYTSHVFKTQRGTFDENMREVVFGKTGYDPTYAHFRINHYTCQSWEFFKTFKQTSGAPDINPLLVRPDSWFHKMDRNECDDGISYNFLIRLKLKVAELEACLRDSEALAGMVARDRADRRVEPPLPEGRRDYGFVMDVGVAEGNDSAFYLAKGFRVVAVEADPRACDALRRRFRREIDDGRLEVLNFAVGAGHGDTVKIFVHNRHQGISGIAKRAEVPDDYTSFEVPTIDWKTLLGRVGLPRYLKIDAEGSEVPFLQTMTASSQLPEFVSAECYSFGPIGLLHQLGYSKFKLVDQNPPGGFRLPDHQMEGESISWDHFVHSSGPFGLDLFQDGIWLNFAEVETAWKAAKAIMDRTWFDCHAWRSDPASTMRLAP